MRYAVNCSSHLFRPRYVVYLMSGSVWIVNSLLVLMFCLTRGRVQVLYVQLCHTDIWLNEVLYHHYYYNNISGAQWKSLLIYSFYMPTNFPFMYQFYCNILEAILCSNGHIGGIVHVMLSTMTTYFSDM